MYLQCSVAETGCLSWIPIFIHPALGTQQKPQQKFFVLHFFSNKYHKKPISRSRILGSKRHRIPDPDSQHCNDKETMFLRRRSIQKLLSFPILFHCFLIIYGAR